MRRFSKSLRLYPTDVWAFNNRGLAYMKLGKSEKARRDFEAALSIDPSFEQVPQENSRPVLSRLNEGERLYRLLFMVSLRLIEEKMEDKVNYYQLGQSCASTIVPSPSCE